MELSALNYKTRVLTSDGIHLHLEIKENDHPEWLLFTHGIGEHCGRHSYLIELFADRFNIAFYDLRGHGQSEGRRAYIDRFDRYLGDLQSVIDFLCQHYAMKSYTLMGHSMGALITAFYLQLHLSVEGGFSSRMLAPRRAFLSAPTVGFADVLGKLLFSMPKILQTLAGIPFSIPLKGTIDLETLSHRSGLCEEYVSDPLNSVALSSHLLLSLMDTSHKVFSRPLGCRFSEIPLAVAVGSKDQIVDCRKVKDYFTKKEPAERLKVIDGGYHELHNEIAKYRDPYFSFLSEFLTT